MITDSESVATPYRSSAEICVIGSGAGGATAAAHLAALGHDVALLEQGGAGSDVSWHPAAVPSAGFAPPPRVLAAQRLGGSAGMAPGICLAPRRSLLTSWEKVEGVRGAESERMDALVEEAMQSLGANPASEQALSESDRSLLESARGLGWHPILAPLAKTGLADDLVQQASKLGARVFPAFRVAAFERSGSAVTFVSGAILDRRTGRPRGDFRIQVGRACILAAGALTTPLLLDACGVPDRSGRIGKGLRVHPVLRVTGFFGRDPRPTDEGISTHRPVIFVDPPPARGDEPAASFLIHRASTGVAESLASLPGLGKPFADLVRNRNRLMGLEVMLCETSTGEVGRGSGGVGRVCYHPSLSDRAALMAGMRLAGRWLLSTGATRILVGPLESADRKGLEQAGGWILDPGQAVLVGRHPMGTCRLGEDPARAVADSRGLVHGMRNLFVADGSCLPGTPGVPPLVTILALARGIAGSIQAGVD